MKPINQKAEILQQFEQGIIDLQDLKANQLFGIGTGGVHFSLKGFEDQGCLNAIQIDEIATSGNDPLFAPCEGAYFYTPHSGSLVIVLGSQAPDKDQLKSADRKVSSLAYLWSMEGIGNKPPKGWTPAEEESRNQKIELEIITKRKKFQTLLT